MSNLPKSPEQSPSSAEADTAKPLKNAKASRRKAFVPRAPGEVVPSMDEWLLSYSDMVTLLLTMFIALLLTANFDKTKPSAASEGPRHVIENLLQLRVASPYLDGQSFTITGSQDDMPTMPDNQGTALAVVKDADLERIRQREAALNILREQLKAAQLNTSISADVEGDGIRLNIPNSILFDTGAAELKGRGPAVIKILAPILAAGRYLVSVEGHTDTAPIKTDKFPSNWELSAQRAATVVRSLAEAGIDAHRLQAVGYGESRPLADNATEDGRRENRRVTLFLRSPK